NRAEAEPGLQRHPAEAGSEEGIRRNRWPDCRRHARRLRAVHRERDAEVGRTDQVGQYFGRLISCLIRAWPEGHATAGTLLRAGWRFPLLCVRLLAWYTLPTFGELPPFHSSMRP